MRIGFQLIAALAALCSSSVQAGQGWYLMQPPSKFVASGCDEKKVPPKACSAPMTDPNAPLRKWGQVAAFDTASACETFREREHKEADTAAKQIEESDDYWLKVRIYVYRSQLFHAKCIATDDSRLK